MTKPKIIAMIPARIGSERLKYKNLRMLLGKPVIAHVIDAAKNADIFDRIVLNSDDQVFEKIAGRYDIDFYARPRELGSSEAKSDDVVVDFMGHFPGDILVWVNPIAPLQRPGEIADVINYFIAEELDSLITVKTEQVHCLFDGSPLNFSDKGLFAKTQDLMPVQSMVYSIMMWRYDNFLTHYNEHGYALLSGKVGYFPVHRDSTVILKYEEDLRMAEAILSARDGDTAAPSYDPVVEDLN